MNIHSCAPPDLKLVVCTDYCPTPGSPSNLQPEHLDKQLTECEAFVDAPGHFHGTLRLIVGFDDRPQCRGQKDACEGRFYDIQRRLNALNKRAHECAKMRFEHDLEQYGW